MFVALSVIVTFGFVACSKGGVEPGEARVDVNGVVRVEYAKGGFDLFDHDVTLHEGDIVQAVEGSYALELADGARLEGRVATKDAKSSRVLVAEPPELQAGELLAVAEHGTMIDAAGTRFVLAARDKGETAVRLSRSLAVGVAAYDGSVTVDSAGQERSVPALREMEISALGRPPATARPLTYDETDPWDLRFLGDAVELGRELEAFARSYTASLPDDEGRTVGFYQLVVPGLDREPAFTADLLTPQATRRQGDLLIGTAISLLGDGGTFGKRWSEIFSFHDEGATWGLVALDQGVKRAPLVRTVEEALNASSFEFTAAGPSATAGDDGGRGATASGGRDASSGGAGGAAGDGGAAGAVGGSAAGSSGSGATGGSAGSAGSGSAGSGGGGSSGGSGASPTTKPGSTTSTTAPRPATTTTSTTTTTTPPPPTSPPTTGVLGGILDPIGDLLCGLLGCH